MTTCIVGREESELRRRVQNVLERTDNDIDVDDYIAESAANRIVGTTEQVVERLKSYAEVGVERVMLQHLNHTDLDMVRLIGSDIREAL